MRNIDERASIHQSAIIHPTAVIYGNVTIEQGVYIGAFCEIGLETEEQVHPVIIGINVKIGSHCRIGAAAETKKSNSYKGVIIHEDAHLHGFNTVDAGTTISTTISERSYIMKHVHVGHDVVLGEDVTAAPFTSFGGHVTVGNFASFGMKSVVHPQCVVSEGAMVGAGCVIARGQSVDPWRKVVGVPSRDIGWNSVGMERHGMDIAGDDISSTHDGVDRVKYNLR